MTQLLRVGIVSAETTEQQIRDLFAPFGSVPSARVMHDAETQKPRGFGPAEIATPEATQDVIRPLAGHSLSASAGWPR